MRAVGPCPKPTVVHDRLPNPRIHAYLIPRRLGVGSWWHDDVLRAETFPLEDFVSGIEDDSFTLLPANGGTVAAPKPRSAKPKRRRAKAPAT